ncbi:hypothetical protein [Microbacterium dextranolyticum]|uniref:hypothetical protein n=1 Tax=Microbacterium dextranolyticum TaxID=36806 RepID=UPI0022F3434F|nr:hypothetical protein [Microbacterium dextranolyticum]
MRAVRRSSWETVLGAERSRLLEASVPTLRTWVQRLEPVSLREWELPRTTLEKLQSTTSTDEEWLVVKFTDGSVLATDDFSALGRLRPVAAVIYPELDSRLWAWCLTHAWSSLELALASRDAIRGWSLASASTLTRSLLESVAAFWYETRQLCGAWRRAKKLPGGDDRPVRVRQELNPRLLKAFRGTRLKESPEFLRAPNVLTWIERLARDAQAPVVTDWYDKLSDAAHPSAYARTLYSSVTFMHESHGKAETLFSYSPIVTTSDDEGHDSFDVAVNEFPRLIADTWILCADILLELLPLAFKLPADFTLTSRAVDLVGSPYLRNMWTEEPCPCGCGGSLLHKWSADFPLPRISKRSIATDRKINHET